MGLVYHRTCQREARPRPGDHAPSPWCSALPPRLQMTNGSATTSATVRWGLSEESGILEDELHIGAHLPQRRRRKRCELSALENHGAKLRGGQAQERSAGGGLTAARLAHKPESLTPKEIERHARHRLTTSPTCDRVRDGEVGHRHDDIRDGSAERRDPGSFTGARHCRLRRCLGSHLGTAFHLRPPPLGQRRAPASLCGGQARIPLRCSGHVMLAPSLDELRTLGAPGSAA